MMSLLSRLAGHRPERASADEHYRSTVERVAETARLLRRGVPLYRIHLRPAVFGAILGDLLDLHTAVCQDVTTIAEDAQLRVDVARVLAAHELLADDRCRCGWPDAAAFEHDLSLFYAPSNRSSALWHAEHVAARLLVVVRGPARDPFVDRVRAARARRLAEDVTT